MRFKSDVLSRFWGQDVFLGAWILLPDGLDEHPDAHYPLIVYQDHFMRVSGRAGFTARRPIPSRRVSARCRPATAFTRTGRQGGCRA